VFLRSIRENKFLTTSVHLEGVRRCKTYLIVKKLSNYFSLFRCMVYFLRGLGTNVVCPFCCFGVSKSIYEGVSCEWEVRV
jgi:hypothetical protein